MTVLPIVERELRTASRRFSTYWTRALVALVAVVLGASIFLVYLGGPTQEIGRLIFRGLAGLLLVYCLVQGRRASADCLSEEKREGTLGLLFLTDLKGYDVVLGKLAATSLGGLYGLMAVFPVLALTLLLGGVSNSEFWRMVLVLVHTFVFSLAVGVMSSSLSRDHRRAMAANFFLLLSLAALPPAAASIHAAYQQTSRFYAPLLYSCPAYTFWMTFDVNYLPSKGDFWWSLGVLHGLIWLLVGLASWVVPHTWQDRPSRAGRNWWRDFWQWLNYGRKSKQAAYRRQLLDINAFYWLAARARLKALHVWMFLSCLTLWWVVGWISSRTLWLDAAVAVMIAMLINLAFKVWIAIEAGQRLAEDQQAGALELILSTRLSVPDILRGQWLALRRQFLKPVLAVVGLGLVWVACLARFENDRNMWLYWLGGLVLAVADMLAISAVAMRAALTSKNHNHATITAFTRILVLPWLFFGVVWALANAWCILTTNGPWDPAGMVYFRLWFWPGITADLVFGLVAWRQLLRHFRQYALQRYSPPSRRVAAWLLRRRGERGKAALAAPPARRPRRRGRLAVTGAAGLLLAAWGWARWQGHSAAPPTPHLTLGPGKTPVSFCFWAQQLLIILPDGTLWRCTAPPGDSDQPLTLRQVGTNADWVKVMQVRQYLVGLRRNGELWRLGGANQDLDTPPVRAECGGYWKDLATANGSVYAIAQDGTLWGWIDRSTAPRRAPLGPPPPASTNPGGPPPGTVSRRGQGPPPVPLADPPTPLVSSATWSSVKHLGGTALGVRTDGTLWAWGRVQSVWNQQGWFTNYTLPVQVGSESNWVALGTGYGAMAWNREGELWDPFVHPPDGTAPIQSLGRLLVTNSAPGKVAMAYGVEPEVFEVRADGTLWRRIHPFAFWVTGQDTHWRQIGTRTDWVSVWGLNGIGFGLTRDGTLWTWGVDFAHLAGRDLATRFRTAHRRLTTLVGASPAGPMGRFAPVQIFVEEPRPLLHLDGARFDPPGSRIAEPVNRRDEF